MAHQFRWRLGTIGAIAVLAATAGGLTLLALGSGGNTTLAADPSADRGARGFGVGALGHIEPAGGLVNVGAAAPDLLETLLVRRGDCVKKGQALGYLQSYAEQAAQHEVISAQLQEAEQKLAAVEQLDQTRIDDAQTRLQQIEQVDPLRIVAQQETVRSLEKRLTNDQEILDADTQLMHSNFASRRTHDNEKTQVKEDKANLAAAQDRLQELRQQFAMDDALAKDQIKISKADLAEAKSEIPIASLKRQRALAEVRMRNATIYAPSDGCILNTIAHPGEQVGQIDGRPILTMGNTARMRIVAEVYETDIGYVHLGARATATSPALDRPVAGKVVEIGNLIYKNDVLSTDPAAKVDARVIEVRIDLDNPERTSRLSNLTVDVRIAGGREDGSPAAPGKVAAAPPSQ